MSDDLDLMLEDLAESVGAFIVITFKDGETVSGMLYKVGGSVVSVITEEERYMVRVEDIKRYKVVKVGLGAEQGLSASNHHSLPSHPPQQVQPAPPIDSPNAPPLLSELLEPQHYTQTDNGAQPITLQEPQRMNGIQSASIPMPQAQPFEQPVITDVRATEPSNQVQPTPEIVQPAKPLLQVPSTPVIVQSVQAVSPSVIRKLTLIEVQIEWKIQHARVDLLEPDFAQPVDSKDQKQRPIWDSIRERYKYAVKNKELKPKSERVLAVLCDLEDLIDLSPSSAEARRHYAYMCYINAKDTAEIISLYKSAVYLAPIVADWYNLAALAHLQGQSEDYLAYYALSQVFRREPLSKYLDAWYRYVELLRRVGDYSPLALIYQVSQGRSMSPDEKQHFLESCIYLMHCDGTEDPAIGPVQRMCEEENIQVILDEIAKTQFRPHHEHIYQRINLSWEQESREYCERLKYTNKVINLPPESVQSIPIYVSSADQSSFLLPRPYQSVGSIRQYFKDRNYGFLTGEDKQTYFFHRSSIADDDLLHELLKQPTEHLIAPLAVTYHGTLGPRGYVAYSVTRQRELRLVYQQALEAANEGDYEKANTQIRQVLLQNPDYPQARELYEKWSVYARAKGVPRGTTPYARAKRKQLIEKELEGSIPLFHEAIRQNDTLESAVKDLAVVLMQLNRPKEAIEVLMQNQQKMLDQQPITNLLIDAYQKDGEYTNAITLLRRMLTLTPRSAVNRRAQLCWRIASCNLRQENYSQSEYWFREVVKLGLNNKGAQRNLAVSLLKQGREKEAEQLLQANLPDSESASLLNAILKARETGQLIEITQFDMEVTLADFSSEISNLARFSLDRCTYEGVDSQHRISRNFDRVDVRKLEELASRLGTRRPRERAEYYLSAARIILEHEDWEDEHNQVYKYLCRSFASRGDAAITENKSLDTAREWYCEAVSVYDGDRMRSRDEQDAVNALVRFLFASISRVHVPLRSSGHENLRIDESIEQVLRLNVQTEKMFQAIAYLVFRSQFAANRILTRLYTVPEFQGLALGYLKSRGIKIPEGAVTQSQFTDLWKDLQLKDHESTRDIAIELHTVATRIDFTTVAIEGHLASLRVVEQQLFFDQDRRQLDELQKILETMLDLSQQTTFEEKERLCTQVEKRCQDLLDEIEMNPTRLSVESFSPIVIRVREKTSAYLESIYKSSVPQLTLRLPIGMESYVPDENNRRFEVQIVLENKSGCSPADAMELVIHEESDFFIVLMQDTKLEGSLRGGEQRIKTVPIQVTEVALQSQAFSLPVYLQYRTRANDVQQTQEVALPINLYPAEQFERIDNPYAAYANGHIVGDKEMFYGRAELIANIAEAIHRSGEQSKGIVIYGQKRSGKSSILYHLKKYLQNEYQNLLVVDLGSVGKYLDENSQIALLYQFMGAILRGLNTAIEDEVEKGRSPLIDFSVPQTVDFYNHPTPLQYFQELLSRFKRMTAKSVEWRNIQIVLLLDEFSYIYGLIVKMRLPEDFMKNWKALLQENLFSVVLAGQDFMPKFKKLYANEFAAIQDQRVSYLAAEDARKLIDEPICIGGRLGKSRYREKALERIINLTAASPFYIQIFCDRLVAYMNRKRINLVTQADVEQVKNELISGENALDEGNFDNLVSSGDDSPDAISKKDANAVLRAIAINSKTGLCSRDRIVVETQTDMETILQDLVAREVIEAKGQYYGIRVGLFKEWLSAF